MVTAQVEDQDAGLAGLGGRHREIHCDVGRVQAAAEPDVPLEMAVAGGVEGDAEGDPGALLPDIHLLSDEADERRHLDRRRFDRDVRIGDVESNAGLEHAALTQFTRGHTVRGPGDLAEVPGFGGKRDGERSPREAGHREDGSQEGQESVHRCCSMERWHGRHGSGHPTEVGGRHVGWIPDAVSRTSGDGWAGR